MIILLWNISGRKLATLHVLGFHVSFTLESIKKSYILFSSGKSPAEDLFLYAFAMLFNWGTARIFNVIQAIRTTEFTCIRRKWFGKRQENGFGSILAETLKESKKMSALPSLTSSPLNLITLRDQEKKTLIELLNKVILCISVWSIDWGRQMYHFGSAT